MKLVYSMPAIVLSGGAVHHFSVIARLVARGHEVAIYTPHVRGLDLLPPLPPSVEIRRHPRVTSNLYTLPSERNPAAFLRTMHDLTIGLGHIACDLPADADAVIATFYPNALAADAMRRRTGSRCVVLQAIHADPVRFPVTSYRTRYAWLWASAPRRVDHILVVSEALAGQVRQRYPKPVTVVGNGVDETLLHAPPAEPAQAAALLRTEGRPYLLYVGGIRQQKGVDTLLEAFARLRERQPELLLALVGEGSWEEVYRPLAQRLGIGEHVRYLAGVSRADLRVVLDGAAVFAFPSRQEGFGLPPLEAMARGRPVICSPCAGILSYAREDENCLFCGPGDPAGLAGAVERLLSDEALHDRLAAAGRETARGYSWDAVADCTESALRACVQARRPHPRRRPVYRRFASSQ